MVITVPTGTVMLKRPPPVVTVYPTSSIDNAKNLEMESQETSQHKPEGPQDVRIHILIIILHKYSS